MSGDHTNRTHKFFADASTAVAKATGSHWAFFVAGVLVVASLAVLEVEIANVAISMVTLLMVFVLQKTHRTENLLQST